MASITDLPRELIGAIVAEVSTLQDLDNLMRASRYFLQAVHAWPAIPHIVLRRQLLMELPSGLMACAIGIVEAGNLPRPRSSKHAGRAMSRVLYQVAHDPGHSLNLVSTLCFKSLIKIRDMHKTILSLANAMAQDAWKMLRDVDGVVSGDLVLSGREQHRITKAIYETELLSTVFGDESWETADLDVFYSADGDIYLATKSSWEIEAIGCVLDFFEKRLFEVALDVFTHDVEFGWSSFDYRDMLWTKHNDSDAVLMSIMLAEFSRSPLRQPSSQQLAIWYREEYPQAGEDLDDKGPQMAFDQTLLGQPPFFHPIYAGQREKGYDNTAARLLAMEASWDERAAIYEEGGRGFLKDGDYNGIEWTGEKMKNSHGEQDETSDEDSDDDE
ncbi:major facilitator superfamily transporter multidrug resistance [Colletotrichum chrysophilum]|uniref:Major facilitator superfamily transporter multidrug resistance n=1 Tax=Colletotrichum chrysophilum TaxID=1836956 RepID=A0AAD9ANG5_9PEZI|nr:major facilitator superfamily transporter multidrug resistance [Colletotrichum chrysophilum]